MTDSALNGSAIAETIRQVSPIMYAMVDLVWPFITFAIAISVLYMIQKMLKGFSSGFHLGSGGRGKGSP